MRLTNQIPEYVKYTLQLSHNSDLIRDNVGVKESNNDVDSDDDKSNNSSDEDGHCYNENINNVEDTEVCSIPPSESNNNFGIITNVSPGTKEFYKQYINNQQNLHLRNISIENSISSGNNVYCPSFGGCMHTKVNNFDERNETLKINVKRLTQQQLKAYNIAVDYISGEKGKQMLMFVTGEGGTGKSFLISLIMEYTQLCHGKQGGLYGSAVAVAPTGAAANIIKGYTWQSVYGKGKFGCKQKDSKTCVMSKATAKAVGAKVLGLKLLVLDEISMINLENLSDISERQRTAMGTQTCDESERNMINSKHFGGVHVLFTGDFYQLKPIQGEAIYTRNIKNDMSIKGRKIWNDLNEFIVLTENTRYMGDATPIMNQFLSGARKGVVNMDLLHAMNSRIVYTDIAARRDAGPDAVWIAHNNSDVNKINNDDYTAKVKSGVRHFRIEAQHYPIVRTTKMPDNNTLKNLRAIVNKGSDLPYLELAIGSRVSCTRNLGTQIGKKIVQFIYFSLLICFISFVLGVYNGAKGKVVGFGFCGEPDRRIIVAKGNQPQDQREIPVVFVQMENDNGYSINSTIPNIVPFTEQTDVTEKYQKKYHRWQIPLVPASAITTFKMQGSTVKGNCVTNPSRNSPRSRGLDYVANSRVTEMSKLFLLSPLREENFTSHPKERILIEEEYKRLTSKFYSNK